MEVRAHVGVWGAGNVSWRYGTAKTEREKTDHGLLVYKMTNLGSRWWITCSFWHTSAWPEKDALEFGTYTAVSDCPQ